MKHLPLYIAGLIMVCNFVCSSCVTQAGQLTASEIAPLVLGVTEDLEAYVELGITPDVDAAGEPVPRAITLEERDRVLGGVVILRNAVHTALGEPRERLPDFGGGAN